MGSFLVMRAAVDINNRLQALTYSRLMFAFGCFLYLLLRKDVNKIMFVSNGFLLIMCGLVLNLCSSNSHAAWTLCEFCPVSTSFFFFSLSCVLFFLWVNKYQQLVQIKFYFICKTRTCLSKLMTFLNHLGSTCKSISEKSFLPNLNQ